MDSAIVVHTMNATGLIVAFLTVLPFALSGWIERKERSVSFVGFGLRGEA